MMDTDTTVMQERIGQLCHQFTEGRGRYGFPPPSPDGRPARLTHFTAALCNAGVSVEVKQVAYLERRMS